MSTTEDTCYVQYLQNYELIQRKTNRESYETESVSELRSGVIALRIKGVGVVVEVGLEAPLRLR